MQTKKRGGGAVGVNRITSQPKNSGGANGKKGGANGEARGSSQPQGEGVSTHRAKLGPKIKGGSKTGSHQDSKRAKAS